MDYTVTTIPRYVIAIDPGADGAVSVREYQLGSAGAIPTPSVMVEPFGAEAFELVRRAFMAAAPGKPQVFIERVWASPVMGVSSAFAFGRNFGEWIGFCAGYGCRMTEVTPQVWQKAVVPQITSKGGDRKRALRDAAKAMPQFAHLKPTLSTCDALLISEYALQQVSKK